MSVLLNCPTENARLKECFFLHLVLEYFFWPLSLRCDCTEKLQSRFDFLRSQLNDISSFKNIYRYAFDFARVGTASPSDPKCFHFMGILTFLFCFVFTNIVG